jgi:hypothetical protein
VRTTTHNDAAGQPTSTATCCPEWIRYCVLVRMRITRRSPADMAELPTVASTCACLHALITTAHGTASDEPIRACMSRSSPTGTIVDALTLLREEPTRSSNQPSIHSAPLIYLSLFRSFGSVFSQQCCVGPDTPFSLNLLHIQWCFQF